MSTSFLDRFLDLGLLPGVDDGNFTKLDAAATKLADRLRADARALRRFSYALLDASLPEDDPVLDAVEEVVKGEWRTLRSSHPARPVQLLRAVLGEAIVRATPDAEFPADTILWLTAATVLPHCELGPEREMVVAMFEGFGHSAEEEAVSAWKVSGTGTVPAFKPPSKPSFKVEVAAVDPKALTVHLKAAGGPHDEEGQPTGPSPNPNWPSGNQAWVSFFGNRASTGISETVNAALSSLAGSVEKNLNQMPNYLGGLGNAVSDMLKAVQCHAAQIISGSQTRIDLLWWKESLYSPSLRTGYRKIQNPAVTLLTLAHDFYDILPDTYPHSAEYFLREVVYEVLRGDEGRQWTLTDFCSAVVSAGDDVKYLSGLTRHSAGRVPLLVFLGELTRREAEPPDAPRRVGVAGDILFGTEDLAIWLLRELQASGLAGEGDDDE